MLTDTAWGHHLSLPFPLTLHLQRLKFIRKQPTKRWREGIAVVFMGLWLLDIDERAGWLTSLSLSRLLELGLLFSRHEHETLYLEAKTDSLLTKTTQLSHKILNILLICSTQTHRVWGCETYSTCSSWLKFTIPSRRHFTPDLNWALFTMVYIYSVSFCGQGLMHGHFFFSWKCGKSINMCAWTQRGWRPFSVVQLWFINVFWKRVTCGSPGKLGELDGKLRGSAHSLQRYIRAWLHVVVFTWALGDWTQILRHTRPKHFTG